MRDLASIASAVGPRCAVRVDGVQVQYGDLAAQVMAARTRLAARRVAPGDRVMLGCKSTIATIVDALALIETRCTVLPVASESLADEAERSRESFAPDWLVCEGDVTRGVATGTPAPPGLERGGAQPLQALLSSGSSGQPKIIVRSAAQVEAGVRIFSDAMHLSPTDRILALVPLQHSFGFNSVMLGAISVGAEIVLPRTKHPRSIVQEISDGGVTIFPAPPLFFEWMHRFTEERPGAFGKGVRACVSVGDILPHTTHALFVARFGWPLWQSYGASEAGPALLNRTGAYDGDTVALGRPYPGVSVDLCNSQGDPVPDGEVGEIVVRSPAVGIGYVGKHDGASRIAGDRFFTGDLGVRRGGEIHFAGRTKILMVRAGRKIDPSEIERVLRSHPDVLDAAVRHAGDDGRDPLQALVVARRPIPAGDLVELCVRSLPAYKVPRLIEFRSALPRDSVGKLRRAELGKP